MDFESNEVSQGSQKVKSVLSLNELQKRELKILCFFKDFCENNGLRYFLAYGTLLGAVRHKGFIPWDDDVDVCMPRSDYERFLSLSKNGWGNYSVLSFEYTEGYIYDFAKLVDNQTELYENTIMKFPLGVYIDIFPLDGCPPKFFAKYSTYFLLKVISKIHFLTYVETGKSANCIKHIVKSILCPAFRKIIGYKWCVCKIIQLSKKWDFDTSKEVGVLGAHEAIRGIPRKQYDSYSTVIFENIEFRAPLNPDIILRNQYGNYMKLPPVHKRKAHKIEVYQQV